MHLKHILYLFLFIYVSVLSDFSCSQANNTKNNDSYTQLLNLLNEKDFFHLKNELDTLGHKLKPAQYLYFQAYIDNAFNRNEEAIQQVDSLLNNFAPELEDSSKAALYLLRGDSYFKIFQYAKAADNDSILLSKYDHVLDSNKIEEVKNKLIIYEGLKNIPKQQTFITQTTNIRWTKNKIGIVEIPVKNHHVLYAAIFDTRANISTITQSYANKLSLQTLPVSYYEGSSITGIRFKTGVAIADSLYLGNILISHVVFQVVPDSILYFAPADFQINIIIGFPVIEQLKEVHFFKDGRMEVPATATISDLHNLALDGLNPVILLGTNSGDKLCFAFDFGANKSILFAAYFQKYKSAVLSNGVKTTAEYGGAGGTKQREVITLPSVDLFLGERKIRLDSVDVFSGKIYPGQTFYGNIGQDFINLFQELIINFQDMYIKGV